jgi:predicted NBD/HSP70 family sugar kinase
MKAIGIDVGGTKIAAALVDLDSGSIENRREIRTVPERGGGSVLEDVISLATELRADATAIGIGLAELVDRHGKIASNATIDWLNVPVRDRLSSILPTRLEADVRAAARAEARFGAGRNSEVFIYVTIGTGISCCLMNNGHPYLGARGLTGTFASAGALSPFINYRLEQCVPLEEFSAGPGLARRYALRTQEWIDPREIITRALAGDPHARHVIESGGRAVGSAIAQLVNTLDPERVVIGGGLGSSGGIYFAAMRTAFYEHLWSKLHADVQIHLAELGPDAGVIGAALAAID